MRGRRRNVGENSLVQSSSNVRSAHRGIEEGKQGRRVGRRRKELWPSLTTVEPATIYPGLRGVDFAGHKREGKAICACERNARARGMFSCVDMRTGRNRGREEPQNQWTTRLYYSTTCGEFSCNLVSPSVASVLLVCVDSKGRNECVHGGSRESVKE